MGNCQVITVSAHSGVSQHSTKVSKLGIPVGEVTLFFRREQARPSVAEVADQRITAASEITYEPRQPIGEPNGRGNGHYYDAAE